MEEKKLIFERMVKAMTEIEAISKDQENKGQGWNFRSYTAIYDQISKILKQNKIYMTSEIIKYDREREEKENKYKQKVIWTTSIIHIRYYFKTDDGSFDFTESVGEGADNSDKATGKSKTMAHKYALMQAFCIPFEDEDPDKFNPKIEVDDSKSNKKKVNKVIEKKETISNNIVSISKNKEDKEEHKEKLLKNLYIKVTDKKIDIKVFKHFLKVHYNVESSKELELKQVQELLIKLNGMLKSDIDLMQYEYYIIKIDIDQSDKYLIAFQDFPEETLKIMKEETDKCK